MYIHIYVQRKLHVQRLCGLVLPKIIAAHILHTPIFFLLLLLFSPHPLTYKCKYAYNFIIIAVCLPPSHWFGASNSFYLSKIFGMYTGCLANGWTYLNGEYLGLSAMSSATKILPRAPCFFYDIFLFYTKFVLNLKKTWSPG